MKKINTRCPLQSECGQTNCRFQGHERDCDYYQGNCRPGAGIAEEDEAMLSEWEAMLSEPDVLSGTPFPDAPFESEKPVIPGPSGLMVQLPVDRLTPHPDNPRKELGDLTELADSIKANGILQNLTVVVDDPTSSYSKFTVIIGHRRLAAAKLAGLKEVPCVITTMTGREQIQTMLLENMQRSDLTVYEQAQGFQMMLDMGDTVKEIAEKSGFSKTTVRRRVKLLELDADKFKKSEARGATLQDYIELEKIEDPELKNRVLDAIGTANFRDALKKAIDDEKHQRRMMQWETDLETFAHKIEKRDYVGEASVPMDYVRNYGRWSPKDTMVERPEDTGETKYYYRVSTDQIDLYKDHQERGETGEERQRRAREQAGNKVLDELKEITGRHCALRTEFIANFSASKKYCSGICGYAAGVIVSHGEWGRGQIDAELAGKLLGFDVDDNMDYSTFMTMTERNIEKSPEYALLACAIAEKENMGYWSRNWNSDKQEYEIAHRPNSELDRLYDFLISLGYEMSDEEKALRDGTHELLHRQEEHDESKA